MNAKVHLRVAPAIQVLPRHKITIQEFLRQYHQRTPRLVIDQSAPRSTYKPDYVPHRDITLRAARKAGVK